jgi:hypothetical protein
LASISSGILLGAPLNYTETASAKYTLYIGGLVQTHPEESTLSNNPVLFSVGLLLTLFPLIILFLYKKRQIQMRLAASAMMANTAMLMLMAGFANKSQEQITGRHLIEAPGGGFLLPALSIIFLFLASKAIRKDDKLIRSADRLR